MRFPRWTDIALLPLSLLLALWPVRCCAQADAPEILSKASHDDIFARGAVTFPGGIVGFHGIEFANLVGYRPIELDLYRSTQTGLKLPLVIWVHGGGWNRGDARVTGAYKDWPAVLASLAARGYVVAAIDYRLSSEAPFPAALQDVKAAIRFLRAHADQYGIDSQQAFVWSGSAGAQLAVLAATTCGVPEFEPLPSTGPLSHAEMANAKPDDALVSDCVQDAVGWYGVYDLTIVDPAMVRSYLRCENDSCASAMRRADPRTYVNANTPPMFLLHGTADTTAPPKEMTEMEEALHRVGVPIKTLWLKGSNHGWLGATPDATRAASLKALSETFAYFDSAARPAKK
jgi:acetyl esterase/lipase